MDLLRRNALPGLPVSPFLPGAPCLPGGPLFPGVPAAPGGPSVPGTPGRPGSPWDPGGPWSPWTVEGKARRGGKGKVERKERVSHNADTYCTSHLLSQVI